MRILDRAEFRRHAFSDPFSEAGREKQYPPDLEVEPRHLEIDLQLALAEQTAHGRVTTHVLAQRNGADTVVLDAINFLDVAVSEPEGRAIHWRYDNRKITIRWAEPFQLGEMRRVTVAYRLVQPVTGLYFSSPDAAYPDRPWFAATDHETERARYWLPCIDLPNVRTTLDLYLRSEARFTMIANGSLVSEKKENDGSKTVHWHLAQRCPSYLICFAVGDLVQADDGSFIDSLAENRAIPVAYFCSPQHTAEDLLRSFGRTKAMLAWMTRKFEMAFPYPKYYQFALPDITGAMENISLVSWGEKFVLPASLAAEQTWLLDAINVHEMSHSYFGDAVVCRDFSHAWLKESWATYVEQLWREDGINDGQGSQDEALYVYYLNASNYFHEADNDYMRPIVCRQFRSSWDLYDCHLYEGGACRLHTLRHELGDEVFFAAMRTYLRRYEGKVVETDAFRHVMEEHSGRSLGRFFDQWFHTAGYPKLKVSFSYNEKRQEGSFEIEQSQVSEGVPAFLLNTEIAWVIDGVESRLPIRLDQAKQSFLVSMSAEPQMVRFDPGCKALHKLSFNPGDLLLRRQLTDASDILGRIHAAQELAKSGQRANLLAIVEAYPKEAFWGVRCEFATALGEAGTQAALDGLLQLIPNEQDPMVLATLMRAAGHYRDPRLVDALPTRIDAGLPELARAAAYESLGKQRSQAPIERLLTAAEQDSPNGYAQAGAMRGLAATQQAQAVQPLLHLAHYGVASQYARPTAASALGELGRNQEKATRQRIVEQLSDHLRDPQARMARIAAHALQSMRATEALDALDAYARSVDIQLRVEIERLITDIRQQEKQEGSALKKQVEELTEKLRKLEDQVQKLAAQTEIQKA